MIKTKKKYYFFWHLWFVPEEHISFRLLLNFEIVFWNFSFKLGYKPFSVVITSLISSEDILVPYKLEMFLSKVI